MIKNNLWFILFIISVSVLFLGASKYAFDLYKYHEECYKYEQLPYIANWSYQTYKDGSYCLYLSGYWGLNCTIVTKYVYYNSTRNGNCSEYILVRDAKNG